MTSPLGKPAVHDSAHLHVTGAATYTDDMPLSTDTLHAAVVTSPHARARIVSRDASAALALPGVCAVLFAEDIPGTNRVGPIVADEPLLAEDTVSYQGQAVALVLADTPAGARRAAAAVTVSYAPLPAITSIDGAIEAGAYHGEPHVIARGDLSAAMQAAAVVIRGRCTSGGQDHFYLETQAAHAAPEEDSTLRITSSTQHPTEIQKRAATVLGIHASRISSEVRRLGGGFGGKESQATPFAVMAALGAWRTGKPVRLCLNRDEDMQQTGKRHPFQTDYAAAFSADGDLLALEAAVYSDGGWSTDLSMAVMDRALFHLDNAYYIPALRFEGRVCATNLPSNTAFRGFGGPQGVLVVEDAINRFAEQTGQDPAAVRVRNFYGGSPRDRAPYGQHVPAPRLARIWEELSASAAYAERRAEIDAFNAQSPLIKRGLGFQALKFGISFTKSLLNQAGALVVVYADGSVQLNHGGAEMGQGIHAKMRAIAAHELGIGIEQIRLMVTSTEKVPNTSPTAASSGTDLNGQAVAEACRTLRGRLAEVAARMLPGALPSEIRFEGGAVRREGSDEALDFSAVATQAWIDRVPLSATGFYATPGVAYDHAEGQGTPFFYFAYGGAVSEVEVNALTGEHRLLRVDILHDVGDSLLPTIDRGQIEGGFVQGWGWLTCEEVLYTTEGQLQTHSPSTYKIPAAGDVPLDFRVALLDRARQDDVIGGSKAVGEPPFMLAISAVTALRHAVGSLGQAGQPVQLAVPCTPEAVLRAIYTARQQRRAEEEAAK